MTLYNSVHVSDEVSGVIQMSVPCQFLLIMDTEIHTISKSVFCVNVYIFRYSHCVLISDAVDFT